MIDMGRKKKSGGHVTPRTPLQMPTAWYAIAANMAIKRKMPTLWVIIDVLRKEAEADGVTDLPPLPWEAEAPSPAPKKGKK